MNRQGMKSLIEKQERKIAKLTVELARERQYSKMLSLLAFSAKQCPERLRQVKRASTLRKICKPRQMRKEAA